MGRKTVKTVQYPNEPNFKSEIDEKYIIAFVKDKHQEQWYIAAMAEAKKQDKAIKQFTQLRNAFWDKFFKSTVKRTPTAPQPNKFQKLELFLDELAKNQ